MLQNSVYWSIGWGSFVPVYQRPPGKKEDAELQADVGMSNFIFARKGNAVIIADVDVEVQLFPNNMWVVSSMRTNSLLEHQQGHFDIVALAARDVYNSVVGLAAHSTHSVYLKAWEVKHNVMHEARTAENRYDFHTDHTNNIIEEYRWIKQIGIQKSSAYGSVYNLPY